MPSKWPPAKDVAFSSSFFLWPWRPPGRYRARIHPMAASGGIWCSPVHAALGAATCINSTHVPGHQNGLRRRYIHSLSASEKTCARTPTPRAAMINQIHATGGVGGSTTMGWCLLLCCVVLCVAVSSGHRHSSCGSSQVPPDNPKAKVGLWV